ncbi:hypothetical protein [Kitasatospora sp. NBC_01266]|uniref:hypothetical protein n=1 Tax=Kitasatospora sp. NBC_01266 TaxID=2903572 RepID=UPI002E31BABA|nr:hypothetical protein [Kitasatospora sp. NBC_01266]
MSTPMLSKDSGAFQQAIATLEDYTTQMRLDYLLVERINEEVQKGWIAGASTAFQGRISDWLTGYNAIMTAFRAFTESTSSTAQILDKANEDALAEVHGGGGASNDIANILSGKSGS